MAESLELLYEEWVGDSKVWFDLLGSQRTMCRPLEYGLGTSVQYQRKWWHVDTITASDEVMHQFNVKLYRYPRRGNFTWYYVEQAQSFFPKSGPPIHQDVRYLVHAPTMRYALAYVPAPEEGWIPRGFVEKYQVGDVSSETIVEMADKHHALLLRIPIPTLSPPGGPEVW